MNKKKLLRFCFATYIPSIALFCYKKYDMKEIWKDVKGYEGLYMVSNLGKLKSLSRVKDYRTKGFTYKTSEKIMSTSNRDYSAVYLYKNKKRTRYTIHRLIAQGFLGLDVHNSKILVCHIDDNPKNNRVDNLFLGTHYDNSSDKCRKGRHGMLGCTGINNSLSKKVGQYDKYGKFIKNWNSLSDISRVMGFSKGNLSQVCNGNRPYAYGFIWKYLQTN